MSGRVDFVGAQTAVVGTIGTIESANITVTVPPISTIAYVATIGTILSANIAVTVPPIATIGTLVSGQVSASIQSGAMQFVGTIGTILGMPTSGTVVFGTITTERYLARLTLQQSASITGGFAATIDMSVWDSVSVDVVAGTVTAGSLQVAVMGVEPVTGLIVSSILASDWLASNYMQRITVNEVAGQLLAVTATIIGTVVGITVSAQRKS